MVVWGSRVQRNQRVGGDTIIVLSAGIEPASQLPQSCVLSIERREEKLKSDTVKKFDTTGFP